jgi:transposase
MQRAVCEFAGMAKVYRAYVPEQDLLLPQNVREWLPDDHLAHFVSDVVDQLDLTAIESRYQEERGYPPYHPRMMTKVLLYGYCVGVFSSRRIQKKLVEDVGFRMLAAGNQPDFRTISDFRKEHLKALQGMFDQVLQISLKAGAMKLGRVVLDGSKVKANASKHKAMSYGRMKTEEQRLQAEVGRMLEEAAATDEEEDRRYGKDRRGDELPAELARRETRLEKIREAKKAVEERAREKAESQGKPRQQAQPKDEAQYNFSDPESRIMKGPDGFVQAYNTQIAVEPDLQLIVGQRVTQAANDKQQLGPLVEAVVEQAGQKPKVVISDSGYCSDQNLKYLENKRMEGFVAVDRESYRKRNQPGPRGALPKDATRSDRMRRKLQTKAGAAVYSIRKTVVEPVFGQIKQARGFRQFLLRGLAKTQGEWAMICLTHNILKLHRLCYQ